MDEAGEFRILEMNPNPYLISLALVKGLEVMGRSHDQMVIGMAQAALARRRSLDSESRATTDAV
jgi:D-alanine-D-alanine ligase